MEARRENSQEGKGELLFANPPGRVVIAYDQLTREEKESVRAAFQALEREGMSASARLGMKRLAGLDPLYVLPAAPEVRMIVRMELDAPVTIMDIVRPDTLRSFAHAG